MMRNTGVVVLLAAGLFSFNSSAWSMDQSSPEYQKMAEYKKAQRQKRAEGKVEKNFWQREASRSGLAGTAAMFTHAITDPLMPDPKKAEN